MSLIRPMAAGAATLILMAAALNLPDRTSGHENSMADPAGENTPRAEATVARYDETIAMNPVEIHHNPYLAGAGHDAGPNGTGRPSTAVCGVRYIDSSRIRYKLRTFTTPREAAASGYAVTHHGACGACSTLKDLGVYLRHRDLTRAARKCALRITGTGVAACLEDLGMTGPCARIWLYNIRNTARHCLGPCLASWIRREPPNRPDGSLNRCIRCDEDRSGPVFKRYAGRTRRNSGIESEIVREAGEILPVRHD